MENLPPILVITPTIGRSPYLDDTMASVRATGLPISHVLACPADQVAALAARFPPCQVYPDQGKVAGLYGAINAGLAAANAAGIPWDWFTYINDDDLLTPHFGEMVRRHCTPANLRSVAYGDIMNIDAASRPLGRMTVEPAPARMPAILQCGMSPTGQQGMLFGRPVVEELGGYTLQYKLCGDLDFWARAHAAGFTFHYYPLEVGRFRMQAGQLSGDVGLTRRELADITARCFPKAVSAPLKLAAKLRYRLFNAPRYVERLRAVGSLATSEQVLASGGKSTRLPT